MKTYTNNKSKFTVAINDVNKNRTLLPYALYEKMEKFALESVNSYKNFIESPPTISKLNILKNAYLNDELRVKSRILKLDNCDLKIAIEVYKELNDSTDTICNAHFDFKLKESALIYAS